MKTASAPVSLQVSAEWRSFSRHTRCRIAAPEDYPRRFPVSADKVSWRVEYPDYAPADFTAAVVIEKDYSKDPGNPLLWAGPADPTLCRPFFSNEGPVLLEPGSSRPLNPHGRTGLRGRGLLGHWGANQAADALVSRVDEATGRLQFIFIDRRDTGATAFPGGFKDRGDPHTAFSTSRELREETHVELDMQDASLVFCGYVDDYRNTDNAWVETAVSWRHVASKDAQHIIPKPGDDARDAYWAEPTPELFLRMGANHSAILLRAMRVMVRSTNLDAPTRKDLSASLGLLSRVVKAGQSRLDIRHLSV